MGIRCVIQMCGQTKAVASLTRSDEVGSLQSAGCRGLKEQQGSEILDVLPMGGGVFLKYRWESGVGGGWLSKFITPHVCV